MDRDTTQKTPPFQHCGHKRPRTRREFLAQGFLSGVGMVMAPSLLSLVSPATARAQAACGIGGAGNMIPFLCLDLAGGANIAGSSVLVGGPGGQLDLLTAPGYAKLGLPSDMTPAQAGQVNTELGLAFHSDSPFLAGIRSKTAATTRARVNGTVICARSENDTDNNPHNPMYGIAKAGADGSLLTLVGSRNSDSGGNSEAPPMMIDPAIRPTKIDSARDATGLVDTGKLITLLPSSQDAAQVALASQRISELKLGKVAEEAALEELVRCGYVQVTDLITRFGDPGALNPMLDAEIATGATPIFSQAQLREGRFQKTAAVMKLVVDGYVGAGTIEEGGYDYHDGTRATGEVRDFLAGQMIGAALEYAARRNRPLMLYVFSDGSVDSDGQVDNTANGRGKFVWRGDNSSTAAVFILVFNPTARPALTRATASQIGYYRRDGSLETAATRVSNNVPLLAEAIVLNFLALHGQVGRFATVLPNHGLGSGAELDSLVAFQPII
jgi:hypothetical protein